MTTIARPQLKTPPGPQTNFFVGNLRDLQRSSLRFYISLRKEYGDIVRFRAIGPVYAYMFFHPKDIEYILRINNQNYHKAIAHQRFKSMLGESLLTSDGNF